MFRARLKPIAGPRLRYGGLLALIGLIALAAISPWRHPYCSYSGVRSKWTLLFRDGRMEFDRFWTRSGLGLKGGFDIGLDTGNGGRYFTDTLLPADPVAQWKFVRIPRAWSSTDLSWVFIRIPLWAIIAAVALPTSLAWGAWFRRRRRERIGHCRECNYDLRGLPTPTCPECGRASDQGERMTRRQGDEVMMR